jgi:hypothetical protein
MPRIDAGDGPPIFIAVIGLPTMTYSSSTPAGSVKPMAARRKVLQKKKRGAGMTTESRIEQDLIAKLSDPKYGYRPDIRDRAALEANFRAKFEELNKVRLNDSEFERILARIVDPDVFALLPHGVLFRGRAEERIRTKLLTDGHIDTVIGLLSNLFFSTGIPVCVLVLKKCKKYDDPLFINAAELFEKGKRQNRLLPEHVDKILSVYQFRKEEERFPRRVPMGEITVNDCKLNISRYASIALAEEAVDLAAVRAELVDIEDTIVSATNKHNEFLAELRLPLLPIGSREPGKKAKKGG